jgi:hypothetical protein
MSIIFTAIAEDMEERTRREQAEQEQARTSIHNIVSLDDLWKFRTGHEQEVLMREIKTNAGVRLAWRIVNRIERAEHLVRAYDHIMTTIIEPSTGKPMFEESIDVDGGVSAILIEAARFDFMDNMNFDNEFSLMEFVLTHENPLFVYEFMDNFIHNVLGTILAGDTAAERQAAFRETMEQPAAEFMRLAIDAYLIYLNEQKQRFNSSRYGNDVLHTEPQQDSPNSPDASTEAPPAPAEPGHTVATAEPSVIITDPNATIHVNAAPVEAAQHKPE